MSLPTADLVHHRHMSTTACSGICGSDDSWIHSLLHYNMVCCVWALEDPDLVHVLENNRELDVKRWIFALMESLPHDNFTKALVTL